MIHRTLPACLVLVLAGAVRVAVAAPPPDAWHAVTTRVVSAACASLTGGRPAAARPATIVAGAGPCARAARLRHGAVRVAGTGSAQGLRDGTLLQRVRLAADATAAIDVVTYVSDGLVVGGIVCYPADGQPHSAIVHVHGGTGGIFVNPDGDMVTTCWNWASVFRRTAFAPSLRGQDGGEGQLELCRGEAHDVAAGAAMLRGLEVTDPNRVGLVGGSIGGCIALQAGPQIPNLSAVVAFVPPVSWQDFVAYQETAFAPASETTCGGQVLDWTVGGPPVAEVIDLVICGHRHCPAAQYEARSPLAFAALQAAPTLVVSGDADNLVPVANQLLYSVIRSNLGHPISVETVGRCDAPRTPAFTDDSVVVVQGGFHALPESSISTGLLFLLHGLGPEAGSPVHAPVFQALRPDVRPATGPVDGRPR